MVGDYWSTRLFDIVRLLPSKNDDRYSTDVGNSNIKLFRLSLASMPKSTSKVKSSSTETSKPKQEPGAERINSYLRERIDQVAEQHGVDRSVLEEFALFVIDNHKKKEKVVKTAKAKPLTLAQIKSAIYQHFSVKNTTDLKKVWCFQHGDRWNG